MLVLNVKESKAQTTRWTKALGYTCPVLLDPDGSVATSYAPADALPDLPRDQIPIASNLIIDREGRIRFYSLLDSFHFDARMVGLTAALDELLREGSAETAEDKPPRYETEGARG